MMTTRELIEAAQLDALGLLEESERDAFEEALATVPAELRLQIRAEQMRLADYDPFDARASVAPDVAPPPGLKEAVLRVWRDAVAREETRRSAHTGDSRRTAPARMRSARRVSPLWRAAAIGFMATAVVFGVLSLEVLDRYQELRITADINTTVDWINSHGPSARRLSDVLVMDGVRTTEFVAVTPGFKGKAAVFSSPEWKGKVLLCCKNLPSSGGTYQIEGRTKDDKPFTSPLPRSEGLTTHEFEAATVNLASLTIVMIAGDGTRTAVLSARA